MKLVCKAFYDSRSTFCRASQVFPAITVPTNRAPYFFFRSACGIKLTYVTAGDAVLAAVERLGGHNFGHNAKFAAIATRHTTARNSLNGKE